MEMANQEEKSSFLKTYFRRIINSSTIGNNPEGGVTYL